MKKNVSILLVLTMLASMTACGETTSDAPASEETAPAVQTEEQAEQPGETEDDRIKPNIPDVTYNGASLRFLSREVIDPVVRFYSEVASSETNGEAMNDATFERTMRMETNYDIKIVNDVLDIETIEQTYSNSYLAGEQNWDVIIPGFGTGTNLMKNGYAADFRDVKYIDIEKPWWDTAVAEAMEIGGALYGAIGAINTWTDSHTYGVTFNKELAVAYQIDPYEMVRNNTWTIDNFYSIAEKVTTDLDGNGVWDHNDRYGISGTNFGFNLHMISSGAFAIQKDENGYPEMDITERFYNVAEKVCNIMTSGNYMRAESLQGLVDDIWGNGLRGNFRSNGALFLVNGMEEMIIFRDLDTDIGLLPLPKYDETQDRYYHPFSTYWASIIVIPRNSSTTDFTGHMLEAMNADAYYSTSVTYYDVLLAGKSMRDPDSVEMLNIIRSSRTMDTELVYNFIGLSGIYTQMLDNKSSDILASSVQRSQKAAEKLIARFVEQYQK